MLEVQFNAASEYYKRRVRGPLALVPAVQEARYVIHTITVFAVFSTKKVHFPVKIVFPLESCVLQQSFRTFAKFWIVLGLSL